MSKGAPNRFLLLYATQTGQAKAIAEEIFQQATDRDLQPELHCLSMTDKKFSIEKEHCVVLVSSTTGDGEPPDTALKFVRRFNKKTLPDDFLSRMNYTVLGLGDTNYTNFCNNAQNIDRRLARLGAKRFYPSGFADEAVGLEVVVDPWIEDLFSAVKDCLNTRPASDVSLTTDPATQQTTVNGPHNSHTQAVNGTQNSESGKLPGLDQSDSLAVSVEKNSGNQSGKTPDSSQSTTDVKTDGSQSTTDGMTDSSQSTTDGMTDSSQSTTDGMTDSSQSTTDGMTDSSQSTTDGMTDSSQSTTDTMTDSSQSTTDGMTDSSQSTTDRMTDSSQSTTDTMTDSSQSTTDTMTDSSQSTTDTMTDSSQSTTDTMTDSSQSTTDTKTDSSQSTTDGMTDSSQSTTDTMTDSSQSTTDVKTDSSQSTTDMMTDSSQSTTDVKTDSSQSTTDVKTDSSQSTTDVKTDSSQSTTDVKTDGSLSIRTNVEPGTVLNANSDSAPVPGDESKTTSENVTVNGFSSQTESCDPNAKHTSSQEFTNSGDTSVVGKTSSPFTPAEGRTADTLTLNAPNTEAPSLRLSFPPLSEKALTLPAATPAYLTVSYGSPDKDLPQKLAELPWQNDCKPPSASSDIVKATIVSAQRLTAQDAVKKTLLLRLNIQNCGMKYCPGDSISVICANYDDEVNQLITRLGVVEVADLPLQLGILKDTKKRRAVVAPHVPEQGATLRYVLKNCVDIREPPKKALLRLLVEYTSDESEKRRLQELCSKEGAEDYAAFIRAENVSLLDVLYTFPSCQPPVERILEHLPRLQPRPYSASSCEDWRPGHIDVAFNVLEIPTSQCRLYCRRGLCTGWLDDITSGLQHAGQTDDDDGDTAADLTTQIGSVSLKDLEIQVFSRTSQHFHPTSDLSVPMIMIGPGTGVAPFIGFLQERQLRLEKEGKENSAGETWLFFGCRHRNKDFLFKQDIENFQENRVVHKFLPAFSQDTPDSDDSPRYVQDNIRSHASELFTLIHERKAVVFVCGDAKNMAKDVNAAFEEVVMKEHGVSADEAKTYVMKMRIYKQYLEDVWT